MQLKHLTAGARYAAGRSAARPSDNDHCFRITLCTAGGRRLNFEAHAASHRALADYIDAVYPDRRYASCICTSRH
ncbi:hypothetical protein [Eleftheria terrae]|uniref:hypothetical protein n=1 Tax=Eleftheria terrae TaxID=1597781 RepID=UPI00263A4778|nr:hypothetical protein [Eleftheria terrae]WKB52292.1 hypothetical protein N7L95_21250 [Eleftheria terrae]